MSKRRAVVAAAVLAGLGLAAAGCEVSPGTGGPSATLSGSTSASGGAVPGTPSGSSAACLVGSWRTTGFDGKVDQGGATARLTGGSGVALRVDPAGATTVDFTGMQPVTVAGQAAGADVRGAVSYGGQLTGVLSLPQGRVDAGRWQPAGTPDLQRVTITVDVQRPVQARLADGLPIGRYASSQLVGVDTRPMLRSGTFRCSGDTLRLDLTDDPVTGTWTMVRA